MARPRHDAEGPNARSRILEAAADLFYRKGIANVGVDEVALKSRIAKMTLYHHFASKDDVVVETLQGRRDLREREWQAATGRARTPRGKVGAAFDYLDTLLGAPDFRGCAFINAAVETADPEHGAFRIAESYKRSIRWRFESIAKEAGLKNPRLFGRQCLMLWDGALVSALVLDDRNAARAARSAAVALLGTST